MTIIINVQKQEEYLDGAVSKYWIYRNAKTKAYCFTMADAKKIAHALASEGEAVTIKREKPWKPMSKRARGR